jgi:hypothetical protein
MDNETKLLLEIWHNFRDIIPASRRDDSALTLIKAFEEYGFDIDASDIEGEDEYLDGALEVLNDDDQEESSDDPEWEC